MHEKLDVGPCCCCGGTKAVRNIVMLPRRAPVPGTGWGCVVCGLPPDGASYVACDRCVKAKAPPRQVCYGYPQNRCRAPAEALSDDVFDHDMRYHPGEE